MFLRVKDTTRSYGIAYDVPAARAARATSDTLGQMSIDALTPYAHVVDVQRSIDFYRRLGLEVANVHEVDGNVVWVFLTTPAADPNQAGARLMLGARDGGPETIDPETILFYCWSPDVRRLHEGLSAAGLEVGPIEHPFYMRGGEFQVVDPDGYAIVVGQLEPP
jgi:catechol 2,3-dioxygenase-like lactoylglutathione lyase family enzyme